MIILTNLLMLHLIFVCIYIYIYIYIENCDLYNMNDVLLNR